MLAAEDLQVHPVLLQLVLAVVAESAIDSMAKGNCGHERGAAGELCKEEKSGQRSMANPLMQVQCWPGQQSVMPAVLKLTQVTSATFAHVLSGMYRRETPGICRRMRLVRRIRIRGSRCRCRRATNPPTRCPRVGGSESWGLV